MEARGREPVTIRDEILKLIAELYPDSKMSSMNDDERFVRRSCMIDIIDYISEYIYSGQEWK